MTKLYLYFIHAYLRMHLLTKTGAFDHALCTHIHLLMRPMLIDMRKMYYGSLVSGSRSKLWLLDSYFHARDECRIRPCVGSLLLTIFSDSFDNKPILRIDLVLHC